MYTNCHPRYHSGLSHGTIILWLFTTINMVEKWQSAKLSIKLIVTSPSPNLQEIELKIHTKAVNQLMRHPIPLILESIYNFLSCLFTCSWKIILHHCVLMIVPALLHLIQVCWVCRPFCNPVYATSCCLILIHSSSYGVIASIIVN